MKAKLSDDIEVIACMSRKEFRARSRGWGHIGPYTPPKFPYKDKPRPASCTDPTQLVFHVDNNFADVPMIDFSKKRLTNKRLTNKQKKEIRDKLYLEQAGICKICENHYEKKIMEVDHIRPLSCGGSNLENNLQLTCSSCNRIKHKRDMTNDQVRAWINRTPAQIAYYNIMRHRKYNETHKAKAQAHSKKRWQKIITDPILQKEHNVNAKTRSREHMQNPEYRAKDNAYQRDADRNRRKDPIKVAKINESARKRYGIRRDERKKLEQTAALSGTQQFWTMPPMMITAAKGTEKRKAKSTKANKP